MNPTRFRADGAEIQLKPDREGAVLEVWFRDDLTVKWRYRDIRLSRAQLQGLHRAIAAMLTQSGR